jgi:AP-4 complex subunit epsilon-1
MARGDARRPEPPPLQAAYLAASLVLDHTSDLIILVVNTLARDLDSDNVLVAATALTAAARLAGPDTVPALLPAVVRALKHPKELVRKKAVLALHRFVQLDPAGEGALSRADALSHFRGALCDRDPSVMAASLPGLAALAAADPVPVRPLAPSLVSILKQVAEGRLPRAYDYHRVPAPFLQVSLIRLLSLLGAGDPVTASHAHAVLLDAMARGVAAGHAAGHAVAAECVRTAAAIAPCAELREAASGVVSSFLASPARNLRYAGVAALTHLVRGGAAPTPDQQLAVIDCLEDVDDALRSRTLELLSLMATPANVEVIVARLVAYLAACPDDAARAAVAERARDLAVRYAPSAAWFVEAMDAVFEAGGDAVPPRLAHDVARLVADGGGDGDAAADSDLRAHAARSFLRLVRGGDAVSATRLTAAAWVLGECGEAGGASLGDVIAALASAAARGGPAADPDAAGVLVTALAKLAARAGGAAPPAVAAALRDAARAPDVALATRAAEAGAVLEAGPATARAVLVGRGHDAAAPDLAFIDAAVGAALARGAAPHDEARAAAARGEEGGGGAAPAPAPRGLRFEAYAAPPPPSPRAPAPEAMGAQMPPSPGGASPAPAAAEPELTVRPPAGARRWGPAAAPPPRAAAPAAAAAAAPAFSATPPAPSPRAPAPRSPANDGRARLAASLFGASPSPAGAGVPRSPFKAPATPGDGRVPVEDLLGGLAELAAPPSASPPRAAAGARPVGLDLDALYGAPRSPQGALFGAATPASPLGVGVAPGADLLGGAAASAPADPFAPPGAPAPPPPAGGDPFADLLR